MTLVGSEANVEELLDQDFSNINAKLVISFNQRRRGIVTQEAFDRVAQVAVEDDDPSIYIKLRSGSRIDHENIKLSRRVDIDAVGTTIDHGETWVKLEEFYAELLAAGQIEL